MSQPVVGNFQIGSFADTATPNGVPVRFDSTISFVDGTRTFTITPVGADYVIFTHGLRVFISTVKTLVIPNVEGIHYIYFDSDGELYSTQIESKALMNTYAYVCAVHWSVAGAYNIFVGDERHGTIMDPDTHYYIHSNPNGATVYGGGFDVTNMIVDGDGALNVHAQYGVDGGEILDEDLQHFIVDGSPQDITPTLNAPVLYREGATGTWRKKTADTYPFVYAGQEGTVGTLVFYNEWTGATWQWSEMSNNNYMLLHLFATNDIHTPMMVLQGTEEYVSLADATVGAQSELLSFTGLPFEEGIAIATFILQTSNAYTNDPHAIFVTDTNGNDFIDWRITRTSVTSAGGDSGTHGDLGEYTLATLPTASTYPNNYAVATDASGGRTIVRSDGTDWRIVVLEGAIVA